MKLPHWKCHKEVDGFQIDRIVGNSLISADANVYVIVTADYMEKHKPFVGGYFVQYLDGYQSFSPAAAFEDGYSKVAEVPEKVVPIFDWYTVEIFPADKVVMVKNYKHHLFLNNVQGAARLIRGRAVNRIVLHSLSKADLVPDVRAALECSVVTHGHQIKPVDFEYQP
jgi:hypothetical protein